MSSSPVTRRRSCSSSCATPPAGRRVAALDDAAPLPVLPAAFADLAAVAAGFAADFFAGVATPRPARARTDFFAFAMRPPRLADGRDHIRSPQSPGGSEIPDPEPPGD